MANILSHIIFSKKLVDYLKDDNQLAFLKNNETAFFMGNVGPDFLYIMRQLHDKKTSHYSNYFHSYHMFEVFDNLQAYAKEKNNPSISAYCLGLLCHYIVDYKIHPFINYSIENFIAKQYSTNFQPVLHQILETHIDYYLLRDFANSNEQNFNFFKFFTSTKKIKGEVYNVYKDVLNVIFDIDLSYNKFAFSYDSIRLMLWCTYNKPTFIKNFVLFCEEKNNTKRLYYSFCLPQTDPTNIDSMNINKKPFLKVRNVEEYTNNSVYDIFDEAFDECIKHFKTFINNEPFEEDDFLINYDGIKTPKKYKE